MSAEPTQVEAIAPEYEDGPTVDMVNFSCRFPISEELANDLADYRRLTKKLGKEDQIIGEDYPGAQEREKHSELWLNQTYNEFHAAIDQAAIDCGESKEEIHKMRDAMAREKDYEKREKLREELDEKLKPISKRLLKEGYKPEDLSI